MSEQDDLRALIQERLRKAEKEREQPQPVPPPVKPGTRPTQLEKPVEPRPQAARPQPQPEKAAEERKGYRFLNPYNFVRYLPQPTEEAILQSAETRLLSRCEPPPHDRYLGLTGRITCTLEAITPLFVSDSYKIELDEEKKHKSYRFFQYEGQDAIPATSLRGMIRSAFEAATNSCFSVFGGERLSYRLEPGVAATLVPARVETRTEGGWRLRLLPGFAPLNPDGRPRALYTASVRRYDPIQPPRSRGGGSRPPRKIDLKGMGHGDPCYALVEKRGIFTYVYDVGRTPGELEPHRRESQEIVSGWLCINNQNIENKSKERIFFRDSHNTNDPMFVDLHSEVAQAYEDLIKDYQARHGEVVKARRDTGQRFDQVIGQGRNATPALSRYMYRKQDLDLGEGTLVYARLLRSGRGIVVDQIAPAAVPRVSYHRSIGDLLAKAAPHLLPCQEYDALCPACRVFGWVYGAHEEKRELAQDKITAYAGRLRVSHAVLTEDKGTLEDIVLAILSSPKPTTTRFYLQPTNGRPRDGLDDSRAGYDSDNELRGRKFYRHQGEANPAEYERATTAEFDGRDDQNRTVRGARKPGNKFQFTLDFHNLAPLELGALLWALELDGGSCHRLGFAKPLGFGSVKLQVTNLKVMDPEQRYGALNTDGGWQDARSQKAHWLKIFQEAMEALHRQPFDDLPNVRDLLALLGEPSKLPIHYPRPPHPPDHKPDPEGKNFEWFVGNKRKNGPKLVLALADEDMEGLPLINKEGQKWQ
jgi:CRISPR-associated protein (TIGR03986 family)